MGPGTNYKEVKPALKSSEFTKKFLMEFRQMWCVFI